MLLAFNPPPAQFLLPAEEIHVWCASLERPSAEVMRLSALLSSEEQARVQRYLSPTARNEFQVSRGILRTLLGRYLTVDPRTISFCLGSSGKPLLSPGSNFHFNVSHSHGLALLAITRLGEVGVDVERLRPFSDELALAERFFTPAEAAALRRLQGEERRAAFFHVWTRKEAFLKASGIGLAHGLERFEVSVPPDEPARLLRIDGLQEPARHWSLQTLSPAPGYVATLAVRGQEYRLRAWRWDEELGGL